ncbi:MAG: HD domain-containing protein [Candidatus Diapherotrites archaeon]|uniref:HD domain-containing protein n=1 Tax=Candidatus Iainarchaeum sp. TaxID=3101447 RepID=A0A938YRQ9_9ARCH|nr:HD domain-containing protein [Candidatus Diapherotrites archaeon]
MEMKQIEERARSYFLKQGHHGFDHTLRVKRMALKIARQENADLEVVEAAALLHDIAREKEDSGKIENHAVEGAEEAGKILGEAGFPKQKIDAVKHCILVHRASRGLKPGSTEAAILQDADRLDVLGATGIARTFNRAGAMKQELYDAEEDTSEKYSGEEEAAINHLIRKCVNFLKPESFNTKTGREIARERHEFLKEFVERFIAEWNGEK